LKGGESIAAFFLTPGPARPHAQAIRGTVKHSGGKEKMTAQSGNNGQTRQEVTLVILVCAVALIATLSVFVPGLRNMWTGLGRAVLGPGITVVQNDSPTGTDQGNR